MCELVESTLFPAGVSFTALPEGSVDWSDLLLLRERWKREGKITVWTNGCFDVLHAGHLHLLEQAKHLGDILVVGVNTDDSVRALKGPDRPIFPLADRIRILEGLKATDYVVAFEGVSPEAALADLKPDVHVKGDEYAPPSGKRMPEGAVVESYGGRIEFIPVLPEHSTTNVIQRIRGGAGVGGVSKPAPTEASPP